MDRKGGLHYPRGSQVREGHESHTSFLDMSVAVNIGRGPLCSGGDLGPFLIRGEVPNPFLGLRAVPEGVMEAGQPIPGQCATPHQVRQASPGLHHSTQTHTMHLGTLSKNAKRWGCSCRSWRDGAGQCTQQSTQCCDIPVP